MIAGTSPDGQLAEIVELPGHRWFVAVQYHPEFKSKPTAAHPLFAGFVGAAVEHHAAKHDRSVDASVVQASPEAKKPASRPSPQQA
jgi:CTP synthase